MTPRTQATWRNHFVPESYLANFVDGTGKVLRTFKPPSGVLHEQRYAPRSTGYQEDLYSIEQDFEIGPRGRTDRIEHDVFGPIDNSAAPVLRKLIQMAPSALNEAERHNWAVFVNSLIERHPQQMRAHFKAAEPVVAKVFAELLANVPEHRQEHWETTINRADHAALARNSVRELLDRLICLDRDVEYFKGMGWGKFTVTPGDPFEFVTGDNAVVVNSGKPRPIYVMSLALSPSNLLVMAKPEFELTFDFVHAVAVAHNFALIAQSEYVYSRNPLCDLQALPLREAAQSLLPERPWDRT